MGKRILTGELANLNQFEGFEDAFYFGEDEEDDEDFIDAEIDPVGEPGPYELIRNIPVELMVLFYILIL
jgi:hypothetical protein